MVFNRSLDFFHFPTQEVDEAVQRRDVIGVISCVQVHILKVLSQFPLVYDVQKHVADNIFSALGNHSIPIHAEQESDIRGLLQTVYRGMRNQTTRGESVERLLATGMPLLGKIFHGDAWVLPVSPLPKKKRSVRTGETLARTNKPLSILKPKASKRYTRTYTYLPENPPKIPDGFHPDWNAKKWRAFCLFYGYSPETNTFDSSKSHSREDITKELNIIGGHLIVYLNSTHKTLASWVPKVKKEKVLSVKPPKKVKKKPVQNVKKIKKASATKPSTPLTKIPHINGEESELEEDEEDEDEEVDVGDDDGEKETGAEIDLSDGKKTLMRHNLNHTLLTPEEEIVLGTIIQNEIAACNQIHLNQDVRDNILLLLDFTPPKNLKKISIKNIKRSVENLSEDDMLTGDVLTSVRIIATSFLVGTKQQKELADTILSEINSIITKVGEDAIHTLVKHNRRLVMSIAVKYSNRGVDIDDLFQEGCTGLCKAAARFDPIAFENKFSTHARWWIEQSIRRAIANYARTIRVPVGVQTKYSSLKKVINLMSNELGHEPTNEEISEEVGIPLQWIIDLKQSMRQAISLDVPLGEGEDTTQGDMIADTRTPGSDHGAMMMDEQGIIRDFLNTLTERERGVLERRFGINGYHPHTLEEIGVYYNVTRERIRQIENKALKKLRKRMSALNPFNGNAGHDDAPHHSHQSIPSFSDDALLRHIDKLSTREQKVLKASYGLGQKKEELYKIGEKEGIPYAKITALKSLALKKLPFSVRDALEHLGKMQTPLES